MRQTQRSTADSFMKLYIYCTHKKRLRQLAVDNILCISNKKVQSFYSGSLRAPRTTIRKGGYTKGMWAYNNYKGDKFDIYVNESGPGGGRGFMCQETLRRERGVRGQSVVLR